MREIFKIFCKKYRVKKIDATFLLILEKSSIISIETDKRTKECLQKN